MLFSRFVTSTAVLAAVAASLGLGACANPPTAAGFDHGMQAIGCDTAPHTPGYGWRYFSDPAARRAVVISPQGDYYYSHGAGLHWVAAEQI
ncbi:MAG: hypothetical protein KA216_04550 [Giesbergeria sp.]|nr:hypothetical protein [Giesbergeria sp.]